MLTHTTRQIIKFSLTGAINTAVDFAVLNALIFMFGLAEQDPRYFFFKAASAGVAIINSYVLNKFWVFQKGQSEGKVPGEAGKFIAISLIGMVLNATIAYLAFSFAQGLFPDTSPHLLANAAAIVGTVVVMIFNFFGYKFLVFKK